MFTFSSVTHSYGKNEVLHDVDGKVGIGATLLLGANGAGKSTLLMLMASCRRPDSGEIRLEGVGSSASHGSQLREYRRAVSWLPQKFSPFAGLNAREHVAYAGWLKGMSKTDAWAKAEQALECVDLQSKLTSKVSSLSGGQQRRVAIAGALVHDAHVLLLDEPTASLDPAQRRTFREIVARISADRTVLVSSHDTDDASSVFDCVIVLRSGRVTFQGGFADFVGSVPVTPDPRDQLHSAYLRWAGGEE